MKKYVYTGLVTIAMTFSFNVLADSTHRGLTCLGKQDAIKTQIEHAQKADNIDRVKKLQTALDKVETNCSNEKLEEKYKKHIENKQDEVKKSQAELKEAKAENKAKKIAAKEKKLARKQKELKQAENRFAAFQDELKAETK